jgi:glycosyltransferase involved in cell wall biosynthesis
MLLPSVPQVVVVHDLIPLHFRHSFPRQYHYFRFVLPAILNKTRAIIAVSENTKRDLKAFYGLESSRIHIVPGGYDRDHYRTGIETAPVKSKCGLEAYLLYVGNLLPHKNLRRLLKAFALISTKVPHQLAIAGRKDPRYLPALEAEAEALGLVGRVTFLDYVSPADLPALYAGAEATVFPSLYEGFGLPILEAMACGTPVIASHAGSLPEVAGDAAVLVDPYNVEGMAGIIETVLRDPGIRETMRWRGLEQVERFSWKRTALMILQVLQTVAG